MYGFAITFTQLSAVMVSRGQIVTSCNDGGGDLMVDEELNDCHDNVYTFRSC